MSPIPSQIFKTLVGTWFLLNHTNNFDNGTINPVYPERGLIYYTESGYMSANIMATDAQYRPPGLDFRPKEGDTDADWAKIGKHTVSYAGPFSFVEREPDNEGRLNGEMQHGPLTFAWVPSVVETKQMRNYTIFKKHGQTFLRLSSRLEERAVTSYLWWRKLKPSWEEHV